MNRYITRNETIVQSPDDAFWDDERQKNEIIVETKDPVDTGLYDRFGNSLFRVPRKIGYI